MKLRDVLLATGAVALLSACATDQAHEKAIAVDAAAQAAYLQDKPQETQRLYARVLMEGERNFVLNHMRAGLAAWQINATDVADSSFDQAILRIESIYADNERAAAARSKFTKENIKEFKGEPYERAMAFYYRGLIDLAKGDYENAGAGFRGGMLQDSLAADERYQADFASLAFLEGWAARCRGNETTAKERFAEAASLRSGLAVPGDKDNVLLIGEMGKSPIKVANGANRELMEYRSSQVGRTGSVEFIVNGTPVKAMLAEDLDWQATTRGGRQIQAVLNGKAQFKDAMNTAGDVGLVGGAAMVQAGSASGNRDMAYAGGAAMLIGLLAKGIAEATKPDADIRYWDNLPTTLHFATANVPNVSAVTVKARFLDGGGAPSEAVAEVRTTVAGACVLAWVRDTSALAIPDSAPNAIAREK